MVIIKIIIAFFFLSIKLFIMETKKEYNEQKYYWCVIDINIKSAISFGVLGFESVT